MSSPTCRFCRAPLTRTFLDLGDQPLANSYLTPEQLAAGAEPVFPLHTRVCDRCFLVQADHEVPAEAIFDEGYAYFSSFSPGWVEHARRYAEAMTERFGLGPESLVVEVASNDGYLLKHFLGKDIPVLGIEPTANTAEAARAVGVRTDVVFFNAETGQKLAARGDRADLMAANNVLAHVPDLNAFVGGFRHVLKPDGVLTFEFPHLLNLIEKVQFDTIYHEHYSYLSLLAVEQVLAAHGLRVFDVEQLPTHGGSLRIYARHRGAPGPIGHSVGEMRARERGAGFDDLFTYRGFAERVKMVKRGLLSFLIEAKFAGKKVAELKPDYILILPWNLKDEIMGQLAYIRDWGGRFVVASPETKVLAK